MSSSTLPAPDLSSGVFTDTTLRDIAVSVRGLSKSYSIAKNAAKHTTAGEALMHKLRHPFAREERETFWALNDVSFDIQKGDVVGIIGRNGAGKSTLLKILSRITEPTTGRIDLYGRVGSLLEVGTGFHAELTGRENIFLNGAILGMSRAEIARQFDAIVDFSGVAQFLDTPVKRYSSGMYVRLAFAVAAHLNPEILIVDEVLAVGDAFFQKKCLGKMHDVAEKEGRTVLFVSHNMTAVQSLCSRVIWMDKGSLQSDGPTRQVVATYAKKSFSTNTEKVWNEINGAPGNDSVRLRRLCVRPTKGDFGDVITVRTPLTLEFEYWNRQPETRLNLSLHVFNEDGIRVFNTGPVREPSWQGKPFPVGLFRSTCYIPGDLLNDGTHRIQLLIVKDSSSVIFDYDEALVFEVLDTPDFRSTYHGRWEGAVRPILEWTTEIISQEDAEISGGYGVSLSLLKGASG